MSEFSKFKEPSKQFLRFAEYHLSNGKADSEHYHTVSFKNGWRVLAPYLVNVKHLSFEESFDIIDKWLDKCNYCLDSAINKGYLLPYDNLAVWKIFSHIIFAVILYNYMEIDKFISKRDSSSSYINKRQIKRRSFRAFVI